MNPQRNSTSLIAGIAGHSGITASGVYESANGVGHSRALPNVRSFRNAVITRGSVILGNIGRMLDTEWATLTEPHERLKWARQRANFSTQKSGAQALQMEVGTYSQYERAPDSSRSVALNHQLAIAAGRKFKVSWTWLLVGEGTPFDRPATEHQRRAIELMADLSDEKQDAFVKALENLKSMAA